MPGARDAGGKGMVDEPPQLDRRRDRRRWAVAGITLGVNLGSFLFLVLVARSARPAVFGGLAALAGIALVFEVPANALQVAVGNRVSSAGRTARLSAANARPMLVEATAWGTGACVVLLALSPLVESFLHLPSVASALLLALYALPVGASVVPKGALAGEGRLPLLATGLLAGITVRLVLGVALVRGGGGIESAFAAMVAGEAVAAAIVLAGFRRFTKRGGAEGPLGAPVGVRAKGGRRAGWVAAGRRAARPVWGEARLPAVAFTGYWALTAVDVVLARHWLAPVSGLYAAAATTAQIALIAPGAIAAIAFPRLIGGEIPRLVGPDSRPNQRLMFALGAAVVAVTSFAAALIVSVLAASTVRGLFGRPYAGAERVVGLLSFSAALLGLVTVLLYYLLNRRARWTATLCWPGIVVAVAGTAVWHRSMTDIAVVMVVSTSTVCAGMLAVAFGRAEGGWRTSLVQQANVALLDAALDLTVVVPYYNPGKLLVPTIERLLAVLDGSGATYEVIAVSDGSTDGSDAELGAALGGRSELTNLVFADNQGKGAALRIGLARGRGRYLGFIDADGDLDPILLGSFQTMVGLYGPDIILGSKRHPLSEVEYPFVRRVYSWGYQQVVRLGFRLNIRDTQTGIKLVRRDVLAAVLPRMVEKRFAFDLELFVIARRLGYKRFLEAPIRLRHQFTSTVSWRSVYRSLLDTAAIWYRLRILHYYDGDQGPATPGTEGLRIDPVVLRGGAGAGAGSAAAGSGTTGAASAGLVVGGEGGGNVAAGQGGT
ncbi:MAG TPA: glycosyltransferase [Acidimicrobiales bacterium]|nr:glycosyltransferase [Acidimicrobiales bacterium]